MRLAQSLDEVDECSEDPSDSTFQTTAAARWRLAGEPPVVLPHKAAARGAPFPRKTRPWSRDLESQIQLAAADHPTPVAL